MDYFVTRLGKLPREISLIRSAFGIEELPAASENDVDAIEILDGDSLFVPTVGGIRGESGGSRVGDGRGGDQAEAAILCAQRCPNGLHQLAFIRHVYLPIWDPLTA